jgi:hypothetical protein
VVGGAIKKAALLGLLVLAAGCTLPNRAAATTSPNHRCADGYMKAMTHTDFDAMYACMGGDLRHRLEERADARNRTPAVQLGWDQAELELAATGDYRLLKAKAAPVDYQLWDQDEALLYAFGTVAGRMGVVLLLDQGGFVGGLVGPFYSSG